MYYRHNLDIVYPERSDEHMITVKHLRDTHFDENYNYYDKSLSLLRYNVNAIYRHKNAIFNHNNIFYTCKVLQFNV